jgi:hypothetical protein
MAVIEWALAAVGVYLAIGVCVGAVWLLRIAPARDPALRGSSGLLRLLFLPGAAALWPVLLTLKGERP